MLPLLSKWHRTMRRLDSAEGAVMKQARMWLLIAAALLVLPQAAFAQKRAGGKQPATPAAPAPASATGEIELDAPVAAPGTAAAPEGTPPATPGADTGAPGATSGGICEIDPSACPKPEDIAKASKKNVNAEIYAVQQIYALRTHRLELQPYWQVALNDQFVQHTGPGLSMNFYITNVLAIGVNGNYYLNSDSDFNFQNRRAAHVAVPLTEYLAGGNFNFTYVPIYGKFAGFSNFIFHYDAYVVGGVGVIETRPIAVIDPDNRSFSYKPKVDFDVGIGLRIFFNRWFAAILEIRDYIFNDQLENLNIPLTTTGPGSQTDPKTWYGNNQLTNDVQAQIGISVFLPFSWEYRLPK